MSRAVRFEVLGLPGVKGSARAILRGGRAISVPGSSDVTQQKAKAWERAVREEAAKAVGGVTAPPFVGVPVVLAVTFRLPRPAGHWGKRGLKPSAPPYPISQRTGDCDKIVRLTADALSGIIFDDDSRVVRLMAEKTWAAPGREGAVIYVKEVER